ncbi:MAG: hypothetical protein KO217_04445 [Methanobacteriaceae archaeon]|jgi:hypothetical protein|nr:MAG: hypothetical protein CIT01_00225 [Methanobacterium sp. BRmetb2]MCC7557924.1 hypothetical protein [Methanobacteriaceae archaeon]
MNKLLEVLKDLKGQKVVFKWGEHGKEFQALIKDVNLTRKTVALEYLDERVSTGSGLCCPLINIKRVEGNTIILNTNND